MSSTDAVEIKYISTEARALSGSPTHLKCTLGFKNTHLKNAYIYQYIVIIIHNHEKKKIAFESQMFTVDSIFCTPTVCDL